MENKLVQGGQGRNLSQGDAWTLWYLALACLVLFCCSSCGRNSKAEFSEDYPSGDLLPNPIRVQLRECMLRSIGYAKAQGADMRAQDLPDLVICDSEKQLLDIKNKGESIPGKQLVGLCYYNRKTIFVLGDDHATLYHELGHWFFGESEKIADDFSDYCMKKDAELERGLSRILNGNDK